MDLRPWNSSGRRKTLVVLGAGASYGTSFSEDSYGPRLPLDLGFFSELQKQQPNDDIRKLLAFVREEFGSELGLSMEEFFSQVEYTDRFHDELKVDRGPKIKKYKHALDRFHRCLPRLFRQAVKNRKCTHHDKLAALLSATDSVISFNYDCVMDTALKGQAGRKWDPERDGYGFAVADGREHWIEHIGQGRPPKSSIQLLKPHGSLNWKIESEFVSLEKNPYDVETADGRVIPPTWFKKLEQEPYASVWREARLAIRRCRALIVIGYSVPPTDLFSRALFKAEAGSKKKAEKLDFLVLVNPDPNARRRFAELVRGGIESTTRVLEFETLPDMIYSLVPSAKPERVLLE